MESDERLISEQLMELRGLTRRTANLKMEVVKRDYPGVRVQS